jgi:hypothetical protein
MAPVLLDETMSRGERRSAMFRFVIGTLVGGLAVWYWGDEIREYAESRTVGVRRSAAKMIRTVGKRAEDVLERTKDQVTAVAQSGEDAIRPSKQDR